MKQVTDTGAIETAVDEIIAMPFFDQITVIEKNSTASGLNTGLDAWLDALAPLGTDDRKPFLETAPYLIYDAGYWLFGDVQEHIPIDYCDADPLNDTDGDGAVPERDGARARRSSAGAKAGESRSIEISINRNNRSR